MRRALAIAALLAAGACAVGRTIRDAAYPTYVEVDFPDGSKAEECWLCVRTYRVDADGKRIGDRLECTSGKRFVDVITGGSKGAQQTQM